MQYVAFLLGINVGKRSIKMADLKQLMGREGYTHVRTVVASGNAVFDAPKQKPESLVRKLESALEKKFGFKVGVIVRTMDHIANMIDAEPFKKVKMTKDIRRYVTFLTERPKSLTPPKPESAAYKILRVTEGEIYSVLDLSRVERTPDVMKFLGTTYGKKTTMRNWNTIEKIAALANK